MIKHNNHLPKILLSLFIFVNLIACCWFIITLFNQYTFLYPENNRKTLYIIPIILVVFMLAISIAYLRFFWGKKKWFIVFLLVILALNVAIFDLGLSTKNTKYTYSYTEDLANYGKYDTVLTNESNTFDTSFFPSSLQGLNVEKFSYYFDCYDCTNFELFLQIKMNSLDKLNEYKESLVDILNTADKVTTLQNIDIYLFNPYMGGENLSNKYANSILINKSQIEIVFVSIYLPNEPFGNHISEYNKYLSSNVIEE